MRLAIALVLLPSLAWAQGQAEGIRIQVRNPPVGSLTATKLCRVDLTAVPPDGTPGWRARFFRGAEPTGAPDRTPPYRMTDWAPAGSHAYTVQWEKDGVDPRTTPATEVRCP
jgi:hypothetical protein